MYYFPKNIWHYIFCDIGKPSSKNTISIKHIQTPKKQKDIYYKTGIRENNKIHYVRVSERHVRLCIYKMKNACFPIIIKTTSCLDEKHNSKNVSGTSIALYTGTSLDNACAFISNPKHARQGMYTRKTSLGVLFYKYV